jgi:hypothetical protein
MPPELLASLIADLAQSGDPLSSLWIRLASATSGAIDCAILQIALNVFHLCQLLVDHPVHIGHFHPPSTSGRLSSLAKSVSTLSPGLRV